MLFRQYISFSLFDIQIKTADKVEIEVNAVFTHAFSAQPGTVGQGNPNGFVFVDNLYISSPYKVKSQTTKVTGLKTIISASDDSTLKNEGDKIEYGPFKAIPGAFKFSELKVHFLTPVNPMRISKLLREVEVSHWGNVAVEETFEIYNDGAALESGFSRVEYMYGKTGNSFNLFTQFLPRDADDVYYRDVIGNISSSHIFPDSSRNKIKFDIQPRFVMFGGWKIEFYTGYNLPAAGHLGIAANGDYVLTTDFSVTFLEEITIDDFELRVILPEGSAVTEKKLPFPAQEEPLGSRLTYLDTSGRPVLTFKSHNLINEHNLPFEIRYSFPSTLIFKEPLLLIGAYFAFFFAAIVYFRADFSLHSEN